jgi:hypothetical protein
MLAEPIPLTRRQRVVFWALAVVCGATRFLALARSLWDWDEALFCLGLRRYDVALHHPHPPGFPLFIALGRLLRLIVPSDFRSLQTISIAAGLLVFPAVFLFGREIRLRFETAAIAGALCAFLPNVWFFCGTAFSDVPSMVVVLFSVAFLFRGAHDGRAYLIGSFLLAIAIGVRPQNVLVGLLPGIWATWHRWRSSRRDVFLAASIGIVVVAASYGEAMWLTGPQRYLQAVGDHRRYIASVDSFRSPDRPPLWRIFDRFFIKQYGSPALSAITSLFVLIGTASAVRRRSTPVLAAAAAFVPFAIVAWLMLDLFSISRFSIGYIPFFAVLAAYGISAVAEWAAATRPRQLVWFEAAAGSVLVLAFFFWTLPALTPVRETIAPPEAAVAAVPGVVDPRTTDLYVGFSMRPFMEYFLPDFPWRNALDDRTLPIGDRPRRAFLLAERDYGQLAGLSFIRPRGRLWNIARRHYFDVSLSLVDRLPQFAAGWYPAEQTQRDETRWMMAQSKTILPRTSRAARLQLRMNVSTTILPEHPHITVALNGREIDRIDVTQQSVERAYEVTANSDAPNVLELAIDKIDHSPAAGGDPRFLGIQLRMLAWGPR